MLRRLSTYAIALASATAYAAVNLVFEVRGAADVALFALCGLVGAAVAVPLFLGVLPRRARRHGASGTT